MRCAQATLLSVIIAHFALGSACTPSLGRGDDDDSSLADDDDSGPVGDDDSEPVGDDDTVGDDDDSVSPGDDDDSVSPGDDDTGGGQPQPPVLVGQKFEAGWSFGECGGLCFGNLLLGPAVLVVDYTIGSWEGTDSWSLSAALTSAGEGDLVSLFSGVDYPALDSVYGCPDCADGGASSMTWHEISVSFATEYDYGDPPPPLVSLDQAMRAIMEEAEDCTFSYWLLDPGNCVPR